MTGVPEISASVETLIQLFSRLPPSDLDRGLIFPICLAACMTNDSTRRDFFKNRIRNLNESFGNLLQIRRIIPIVGRINYTPNQFRLLLPDFALRDLIIMISYPIDVPLGRGCIDMTNIN